MIHTRKLMCTTRKFSKLLYVALAMLVVAVLVVGCSQKTATTTTGSTTQNAQAPSGGGEGGSGASADGEPVPPEFIGDPKAPVKLVSYYPINAGHKEIVDHLKTLPQKFGGKVYLESYDIQDTEKGGQDKWSKSGLSCAGVFVNGKTNWTVLRNGKKEDINFIKRPGSFWSYDDLDAVIKSQLEDPKKIPVVPGTNTATSATVGKQAEKGAAKTESAPAGKGK